MSRLPSVTIVASVICISALVLGVYGTAPHTTCEATIDALDCLPAEIQSGGTATNNTADANGMANVTILDIPSEIAATNNRFALDFYRQVSGHDGNIFFSPLSMYTAFSMVYEGARGETAGQMQSVFGFEPDKSLRHNATASLMSSLNRQDPHATLTLANSLWLADWFYPYDSYLNTVNNTYLADIDSVDFSKEGREESARSINGWAANKTQGKIPSVINPQEIKNDTSSVLLNAIYFKGTWENQFKPERTTKNNFWTGSQNVMADFMRMKSWFDYAGYDGVQVLRMSYDGDRLSMLIILPSDKDGLDQLEDTVTAGQIGLWLEGMYSADVIIQIPKFEVRTHYELNQPLMDMGVKDVFHNRTADLSGMAELKPDQTLYVKRATQDAYVKVNEEGTEAAAVTAISGGMNESIPPPPIFFTADHPFLFLIQDDESGAILFMGRVSDPSCTVYDPGLKQCIREYSDK